MKQILKVKNVLLKVFILSIFVGDMLYAQDETLSISPAYLVFSEESVGDESDTGTITITNESDASGIAIGTISMDISHSEHFTISSDSCSNVTLSEDESCTLQVKFVPTSTGVKSTIITIPNNDNNVSVFLTNSEDTQSEAERRLPPIVSGLDIDEELNASTTYDLNVTAMGYSDSYDVIMVMFDCTDISDGTCASTYGNDERFYTSATTSPSSTTTGNWSYSGEIINEFLYTYNYTIPDTREDGSDWSTSGTTIVIRFYIKSTKDSVAEQSSLSLIIPGNLSNDYYDTSGRKIQKTICPSTGCVE